MLVILNVVFGGSVLGVVSATAGATLISLYLLWKPVILFSPSTSVPGSPPPTGREALNTMAAKFDSLFTKEP